MIKNFKFSGIVLLVAGLSFAAAGCTKQVPETSQFAEEQTEVNYVDFNELTKDAQVAATTSVEVVNIVEEILKNIDKELLALGQAHNESVDDLHLNIFRGLASFCSYHSFNHFSIDDQKGFFKAMYKLKIGQNSNSSYIALGCKGEVLTIAVASTGAVVKIEIPDWVAVFFEKGGKFDFTSKSDNTYTVTIGRQDTIYAVITIDANAKDVRSFIYDENQVIVAGSYWAGDNNKHIWYNNRQVAGDHPTDIKIYDLGVLEKDLELLKGEFTYTQEQAEAVANEFNSNVTCCAVTPLPALLCGQEFKAVVDGPTQAGFYRAFLKCGENYVPADQVFTFVEEWLKKVLSE